MATVSDTPHGSNLALELTPDVVNRWFNRNPDDPSLAVGKLDKKAGIEASVGGIKDFAWLPVVVFGRKMADSLLVDGADKFLLLGVLLLVRQRIRWQGVEIAGRDGEGSADRL